MSEDERPVKPEGMDEALEEMHIAELPSVALEQTSSSARTSAYHEALPPADLPQHSSTQISAYNSPQHTPIQRSNTPVDMSCRSQTPVLKEDQSQSEVDDPDTLVVEEAFEPRVAKPLRKVAQKLTPRPPPLFNDYPDKTEEATSLFEVIRDCMYGSKYMGSADHDSLGCDCNEEFHDGVNHACGEDSDCINRLTKIECVDDECHCGPHCQNQRFQRKQFAKVSVIKTEKKGYGLRADTDLAANDFIFEYIGEVINEPTFRRRTIQYDGEGIKHFYFMSLTKSEFVDATKKGNLGRFCNHSCNPNSYVDKWVVGDKLRMGIFAERDIKAGEELVFNYNVDRYGADPTPCYCGEPNCTGFLGGKTQTERATKLSHTTIEALGIDDDDGWDLVTAKKPKKKKTGEADEEWVASAEAKPLDFKGIAATMGTLMQCKEKWIVVKLLDRIIRARDEKIYSKVVQFHGYTILRSVLKMWNEDNNVILQVLDILSKLPRVSKNKIVDSKIEPSIQELTTSEHEDIAAESTRLLEDWSKLELAYRIPRKKFDAEAAAANLEMMKKVDPAGYERMINQFAPRRDVVEQKPNIPSTPVLNAPTGPRGTIPQRGPVRNIPPVVPRRPGPLPAGWFPAQDSIGRTYYYSKMGAVTWQRPTIPAAVAPASKPTGGMTKAQLDAKYLQDIIDGITKEESKPAAKPSPMPELESPVQQRQKKEEYWRGLPEAKQMKIYENTLAPVVVYVMNKYRKKMPKEDLKRYAKEITKKTVASDYKRNRVDDPTRISREHEKAVKKHVYEFFDKAFKKYREHEKKKQVYKLAKAQKTEANGEKKENGENNETPSSDTQMQTPLDGDNVENGDDEEEVTMDMSEDEDGVVNMPPTGESDDTDESRKRKHDAEHGVGDDADAKRVKDDGEMVMNGEYSTPPPPPPPPPPPQESPRNEVEDAQDAELKAAQRALEKENEEAAAMEEAQGPPQGQGQPQAQDQMAM